jgi:hypothetical protein
MSAQNEPAPQGPSHHASLAAVCYKDAAFHPGIARLKPTNFKG